MKGDAESIGDAIADADADASGAVKVPIWQRQRLVQPRDWDDERKRLEALGLSVEDLRHLLKEGE
jgi:hypothetical protein